MTRVAALGVLVVASAACGLSSSPTGGESAIADAGPDAVTDCPSAREGDAYACAEARFWAAFRQAGLPARKDAEATLIAVIAANGSPADNRGSALMHFRLAQLRLAMSLENGQRDYVIHSNDMIVGELDRATTLDAYGGIIAPWKDAMQIATAAILGDWGEAVKLANRGFDNIALNPLGNTLSLSGTTIGFPMSTGVPARTASFLDRWRCAGVVWCDANTEHAPYARPGLGYHFAEAYARVGDADKARRYLAEALSAPGTDTWPYKYIAERAAADVGAFVKRFADLGADGSAFDVVYANQPYGCLFCHAKP